MPLKLNCRTAEAALLMCSEQIIFRGETTMQVVKLRRIAALMLAAFLAAGAYPSGALADNAQTTKDLQEQLRIMQQRIEELSKQVEAMSAKEEAMAAKEDKTAAAVATAANPP